MNIEDTLPYYLSACLFAEWFALRMAMGKWPVRVRVRI